MKNLILPLFVMFALFFTSMAQVSCSGVCNYTKFYIEPDSWGTMVNPSGSSCAIEFDITNTFGGEDNLHYRGDESFLRTVTLEIFASDGFCKACNPQPDWDQVMTWSLNPSGPYHRNDLTFNLVFGHNNSGCEQVCDIIHGYTGPLVIYVNNTGGGKGWMDIKLKSTYPGATAAVNFTAHRVVVAFYDVC